MIRIINADVIDGLRSLPEKSVHCVVTSPPYWGLRDYGVEGQIGLEPTPEEYLEKMMRVFREVHRVLRDDGTLWLNIGDSYANAQPRGRMEDQGDLSTGDHGELIPKRDWSCWNLKQKDLVGMCWRVAFALQAEGWYLRSDIIWAKPNPMPESITDQPTRSHEYVFLFAKSARYFYDADAVRENGTRYKWNIQKFKEGDLTCHHHSTQGKEESDPTAGRNRRDVWTITTQPTPEAHFATFPEALVEPCIKAGTSERGCCSVCGAPWVRVVEVIKDAPSVSWSTHKNDLSRGNVLDKGYK
jgi:DNA modification methylase